MHISSRFCTVPDLVSHLPHFTAQTGIKSSLSSKVVKVLQDFDADGDGQLNEIEVRRQTEGVTGSYHE